MFEKSRVSQQEGNRTPSASRPLRLTKRSLQKWFVLGISILVVGFIMRTAAILAYNASSVEDLLSGRARGRLWPLALGNIVAGVGFIIVIFAIVIYIVFYLLGGLEESSENMPTVTPEEDGDTTSY